VIICPNCGKHNEDRHKFCLGCGARLPAVAAPAVPAPGLPPVPGRPATSSGTQPGSMSTAEGWGATPPGLAGATPPPPPPSAGASRPLPPPPRLGATPSGSAGPLSAGSAGPLSAGSAGPGSAGPGAAVPPPVRTGPPPLPGTAAYPPAAPRPAGVGPSGPQPASGAPVVSPASPTRPEPRAAPPPAPAPAGREGYTTCAACSFSNPPGFAFCGRCGSRLVLEAAPPVVVADVGSAQTVFVEQAPEELRQLRDQARSADGAEAPAPVVAPSPGTVGPSGRLIMLGADGSPIGERVLAPGETLAIGRAAGPPWDEDAYLDDEHGSLTALVEGIRAEDYDSLNGIYVKLIDRAEIQSGDQFRVGQELLLYEDLPEPTPTGDGTERMGSPNPGYWGRLSLLVEPTVCSGAYAIAGEGITIGREIGDITFPHDGYVSGSHCRIVGDDTGVWVEDLGSSNGTYMRVRSGTILPYGSLVLIGQKLFQLERA
jgi:hypothetical protein